MSAFVIPDGNSGLSGLVTFTVRRPARVSSVATRGRVAGGALPRARHPLAGGDLDDAHEVHRVGRAPGQDVVELGREVAGPVVGQHAGELVQPEQDRGDVHGSYPPTLRR